MLSAPGREHVRWYVLAAVFLLSFLTIVDRVCISATKAGMARDLGISDVNFGVVFGAFALGYAAMMVPSGWLADRFGPRRFLACIVALWSCFTLATGLVSSVMPLIAVRFAFGMGESGAYPAAARVIYNWFPIETRGRALGLLNTGSRLGAALGLVITSLSIARLGWRIPYFILAGCGFMWAIFWLAWFRDRPEKMPSDSESAVKTSKAAAFRPRDFLVSRNFYLLLFQYFASNFTFFICFSWLLPYTQSRHHLSGPEAGFYASIPLYFGAFATWFGGYLVDAIYRAGHWRMSRALPAASGFGVAALCLVLAGSVPGVKGFIACFALATLGVDLAISPSWTTSSDVGRESTGTLSGCMNMMGSLGSFASSLVFPRLLELTGSVQTYFLFAAFLNVVAILCWAAMRPDRPILSKFEAVA